MTAITDLVMPKLGLTMTEGRIARWSVAPGATFAPGDVVVVIETDKIANEIEAPSAGRLVAIVAAEGDVLPVGAPMARWALDHAPAAPAPAPNTPAPPAPVKATSTATAPAASAKMDGAPSRDRVIATPYARRLARDAAVDVATIQGSGPRGRVRAADVIAAASRRDAAVAPLLPAASLASDARALSFATIDVDVTAVSAIEARLRKAVDRDFERRHYIGLACLRALDHGTGPSLKLGFEIGGGLAVLEPGPRTSLSVLARGIDQLDAPDAAAAGDIAILVAGRDIRLFGPALPAGWRLALGVGGVRRVRTGAETTHEMSLVLSYDGALVDHGAALQLLRQLKSLLEEPLQLLAG